MRHRMQCSVVTDQSVSMSVINRDDECPVTPPVDSGKSTFFVPGKKWDKKQKVSSGMLVHACM